MFGAWNWDKFLPWQIIIGLIFLLCLVWLALLTRRLQKQSVLMQAQLRREHALADLGGKLASAATVDSAARIIAAVADDFFGWDACYLNLYLAEQDRMQPVLNMDTVDGKQVDVPSSYPARKPSPMAREIVLSGAKLILRDSGDLGQGLARFGDTTRLSASLMFVPIRNSSRAVGIFSIQSYTAGFYDQQKLQSLQALADHCGGALERIRTREELQKAHDELESRVAERTAELTRANALLRESQEEQRIIFDSVPAAITYKNRENRIIRSNQFHAEILGLPLSQIEGRTVFELNPRFADQYYRDDQEIIRSGNPLRGVVRPFQRADGEVRWLQTDKIPYRDAGGKVVGVIAFSQDITERKAAEEALRKAHEELESRIKERTRELSQAVSQLEQEIAERRQAESRASAFSRLGEQLSAATDSTAAAQIVLDVADEILGWDASYLHFYTVDHRYTIPILMFDEVDGERTQVFGIYREISARDRRLIEHGAEFVEGVVSSSETPFVPFGVRARPTVSRLFVPIHSGAKVVGAMSVQSYREHAYRPDDLKTLQSLADFCSGTLERIQIEQSLRQSEERFSKAFRSSPVSMSLTTLEQGIFLDVNDSMLALFGFTREELLGRTSIELGFWIDPDVRTHLLQQLQEKKVVRNFQCRLKGKSGSMHDILLSLERLDFAAEPVLLGIFYDMTDRLNLESQLRHSQKMEAVGQLAAGIAHDFNNVLTIIQGHVGLLSSAPELPQRFSSSLIHISEAAERAGTLTKQLLTFSRKQVMQPRALDLNEIVRGTAQILQRLLGESIALQFDCVEPQAPLFADPGMMEQIIMNLAVNARDAMPRGGRLAIRTERIDVTPPYLQQHPEALQGDFICLTVSDTGCGMDAQTVSRIFEPFFTTKEVGKGTGLGMATVYGIVQQHAGWIEVDSKPGSGAVFKIFLPAGSAPIPDEKAAAPLAPGGHETIMVVEDEAGLRELVCSLLEHFGYRVIQAGHGKEAMAIWTIRSAEIDLLLTDMMMPEGISGWELADTFQKERPSLKVIYTSGYSVDLFGHGGALREGMNFLPKPYHPDTLAKTIRECLDS